MKEYILKTLEKYSLGHDPFLCWGDNDYEDAYRIAYSLSFLFPEDKLTDYEWFCNKVIYSKNNKKAYREGRHRFSWKINHWYYETLEELGGRIKEIENDIIIGNFVFEQGEVSSKYKKYLD